MFRIFSSSSQAALLAVCVLFITPLNAGRPLITDDAAVVDAGACQIESWFEQGANVSSRWINPGCNPFGSTEIAFAMAATRETGEPSSRIQLLQAKQLLRAFDDNQAGYAVAVGAQRHQRDRQYFVNAISTIPLNSEANLLHVNLGVVADRTQEQDRTRMSWGGAYDRRVGENTRAAVESFGQLGERPNWQAGMLHEVIPGTLQVDVSVGSEFGQWRDTRLVTMGLVWFSPVFLP